MGIGQFGADLRSQVTRRELDFEKELGSEQSSGYEEIGRIAHTNHATEKIKKNGLRLGEEQVQVAGESTCAPAF